MGSRLRVLTLTTFILLPALAVADPQIPPGQDGGVDRPTLMRFGYYFLSVAKTFGCSDFQWAAFGAGKKVMSFEYVPDGTNVNSWTRLMTVTVYPLPQENTAQRDVMTKLELGLLASYSKGKIINQVTYADANGEPSLFLEYEIGEGLQKEHNVGTFLRSGVSSAAFVQVQSRGRAFDEKDAAHIKQFAEKRLRLPGS